MHDNGRGEQWRVILNPRDGTSQFEARVVHGTGLSTTLRAMFMDAEVAQEYADWLNDDAARALAGLAQRWRKAIREYGESVTIGLHPRLQDFIDIWHWAKDYDALTAGPEEAAEVSDGE